MVFMWHVDFRKFDLGYAGVSFFFVLSGFILTYNYFPKFETISRDQLSKFYVSRFSKIYPLHILTFLMAIPFFLRNQMGSTFDGLSVAASTLVKAVSNLFLVQSFFPSGKVHFAFNGVAWSLSNEIFFYIFIPFIMFGLFKLMKSSVGAKEILLFMVVLWGVLFLVYGSVQNAPLNDWALYVFPLARVWDFLMGVMLGIIFRERPKRTVKHATILFSLLELSSLALLIAAFLYSGHVRQSLKFSVYFMPVWCALIYVFSYQKGFLSKLMSHRLFVYLGKISFSFYMVHQLIIRYMRTFIHHFSGGHDVIIGVGAFVISIGLSVIIYEKFEEPVRQSIRQKYRDHTSKERSRKKAREAVEYWS